MITHFAGPICEGADCVVFGLFALAWFLVPIMFVAGVVISVTLLIISLLNRNRAQPISSRKTFWIVVLVLGVTAAVSVFLWLYPKYRESNENIKQNVQALQEETIMLPTRDRRLRTNVYVPSYSVVENDAKLVSEYGNERYGYIVVFDINGVTALGQGPNCGILATQGLRYCYRDEGDYIAYKLQEIDQASRRKNEYLWEFEINFTPSLSPDERLEVLRSMERTKVGDLDKITYSDDYKLREYY